jgi:general secretion pathway protein L
MLDEIALWWVQQMRSLLPQQLVSRSRWSSALILVPSGADDRGEAGRLRLIRRQRWRETTLGSFTPDDAGLTAVRRVGGIRGPGRKIVLRLPSARLLEHRLILPLAAEPEIAQVLRYEIDRVTPFAVEEVFWNWAIEGRDRARARLLVRLSLIPRAEVAGLVEILAQAGLTLGAIESASAEGDLRHLPVAAVLDSRQRIARSLLRVAGATCVVLAILVIALPFIQQQSRIIKTARRIAELQPRVFEAEALRQRIGDQTAGAGVMAAEEARVGNVLGAVAAITDILPDNTFLTALGLSQRIISLTGQSGDAAGLIAALSGNPIIRNPSFSAPVTAAPNGMGSLFAIRAELAP